MAIGDAADIQKRIRAVLPPWFTDVASFASALITGVSAALAFIYSLYVYAAAQTRLATMSGAWLDLFAADFFGSTLQRRTNQSDGNFRATIIANLFVERATRQGMRRVLGNLTGYEPQIFEPTRPLDTGAYGLAGGYGVAGGYGSMLLPRQCFIRIKRPVGRGVPNVAGYGIPVGAYSTASLIEYASLDMIAAGISDADIYAAIDATKPIGTIVWTSIGAYDFPAYQA